MMRTPPHLATLALAALALPAGATDGSFHNAAGGSWADSANWQNAIVGGGAGSSVALCAPLSGNATVSLDADTTVGDLSVDDTNGGHTWTLSGARITLDSGNGSSPVLSFMGAERKPPGRRVAAQAVFSNRRQSTAIHRTQPQPEPQPVP